jgi:hypothetical protein
VKINYKILSKFVRSYTFKKFKSIVFYTSVK